LAKWLLNYSVSQQHEEKLNEVEAIKQTLIVKNEEKIKTKEEE